MSRRIKKRSGTKYIMPYDGNSTQGERSIFLSKVQISAMYLNGEISLESYLFLFIRNPVGKNSQR